MTDKKHMTEMNSQLAKLELQISHSPDIIGIIDASTLTVEEMNPAFTALLGYTMDEIRSKPLSLFLDNTAAAGLMQLAASEKDSFSFSMPIYASDRSVRWLEWKIVVKGGKWFIHASDITAIRELQTSLKKNMTQLEAVNRELESFTYSVSHDLRAPLRALNGNALALEEDFSDVLNDEAKRFLRNIRDNTLRMDRLINELVAFSRIGRKEVRKTVLEMEELVKRVFADTSNSQANNARVDIQAMPEGYGDLSMLQIVWTHLISNAIKYSSKKDAPQIEVGGSVQGDNTEYYIRDNGAGFDMAYAGKLFGTFQRLHDATEFEGLGIGLAIVQRIILKHGGTMRVEAAPEAGACFWFTLPQGGKPENV